MAKKSIGKYTYSDEDKLGHGTFSDVYFATKDGQSGGFAIKLFFGGARASYSKEIEIYGHIGDLSPHILRYEDHGEEGGQPFIVFQQAQEETLRDQINQMSGKPFGTERALAILSQVGSAIIAIHDKKNVIHGDIRPENILFDKNNQALLADFGMAVRLPSKDEKVFKPSPQGDHLYMAPERFGVDNLLRRESDQYSLGCIAYELFTGRHPLGQITHLLSAEMVKQKIDTGNYRNPREYNKLLPDFIERVILKALDKNAEKRHGSVKEFIDALIETPAVIGYGKRYPDKSLLLKNLEVPKEGYFKHLTSFLENRNNNYRMVSKTNSVGFDKFTYTHVTAVESGEARNLVYVPVEFIVNLDSDHYNAVNSVIRLLLDTEEPTLIFYDSFEAPDLKIIEICDHLDTLQAGIWFMPMKYMYYFEVAEGEQKEWIEEIWKMTRSYKKRK
jgi:serine/threonine protein kinase